MKTTVHKFKSLYRLKCLTGLLCSFLVEGSLNVKGQAVPDTVPYQALSDPEIDQLVGPIALFSDPLIAQVLEASTVPTQIVVADRYLKAGGDLSQIDQKTWDSSVKALTHYRPVLQYLDDNLEWATQLGEVFENQQQQVMDSIQRLRTEADNLGNLKSTSQQEVSESNDVIEIEPTDSTTMYVPDYQPDQVFYSQSPPDAPFMTFGVGFPIGLWLDSDVDWSQGNICVWGSGYPRPSNWYRQTAGTRDFSHTTVRAANRPSRMVDRIDRGYVDAPNNVYVQHPQSVSRNPIIHPEQSDVPRIPQAEAPRTVEPTMPEQRTEIAPRPDFGPSPSGALSGSRSAQETHEFSSRGQQSMGSAAHASGGGGRSGGGGGRR